MDHRRAKEKRLKKDAGRTRWSQYFRSMKGGSSAGGGSPRHDKLLDKDELKVDLDSFSQHDLSNDSYGTVTLGMEDGASPHSGRASGYLHGPGHTPPYLGAHSPSSQLASGGLPYPSYHDQIVYTSLGNYKKILLYPYFPEQFLSHIPYIIYLKLSIGSAK